MGKDRVSYFYHPTTVRWVALQIQWMFSALSHILCHEIMGLPEKRRNKLYINLTNHSFATFTPFDLPSRP